MKWTEEATQAVSRVPFFVRKRVKKKVEEEAQRRGAAVVTMDHVTACRQRFLKNMEEEVKGYQVETCFGPGGCPNRAVQDDGLAGELETLLAGKDLREFLKERVNGPLKLHHEFRISASDCPNACSRPQIADIGLIAAARPVVTPSVCAGCAACVSVCREDAIELSSDGSAVDIDYEKCLSCGACVKICTSTALQVESEGYRILLGGKLGRHPQLARELEGIFEKNVALKIVEECLELYMRFNEAGERFGEVLNRGDIEFLSKIPSPNICFKKNELLT
jgi:dissimilatory sulfite reductase (desulfoviridin) alpha/beta subunit